MSEQLRDRIYDKLLGPEKNQPDFYLDRHNNATIGVGYTPVVKGEGGVWKVRPEVEADFKAAGITLSKEHKQAFDDLAYAKNNPNAKDVAARQDAAMKNLGDITIDEKNAKALSGRLIDESIRHAEKTLGKDRFDKLDEGRKTALAGAAYQSPANVTRIGPDLNKAIDAKDWNKAATVLEDSGKRLGDPKRYESYGTEMRDPATPGKIKVGDGDNLWNLSKRLGVSVDELRAANPDLNKSGDIRAGGYLNLPKPKEEQPQEQPPQETEPQPTEPPQETEPQPAEPPLEAEPQPQQEKQSDLGADGQAFLERIGQPNQRPALDIATKDPQHWSKDEVDTVIQDYQRYPRPESLNEWLRQQTAEHFKSRYGDVEMIRDLSGRMVERTPSTTTQPNMPVPDLRAAQKNLEALSKRFAHTFDADGHSGATKSMQQGLNLLNRDQMPSLKTDGDWGPITDFTFKKSVASHGTAKVDEGFALGRLQSLAEKPQQPEDLARQTQNILGPLYGSQEQGDDHALALQAGLNRIGPKYQDDWQPLKLDGEIGPKTASAFNSLAGSAGPMALSERIGSVLGWLE